MSEVIPARFLELFQKKSFGHLATLLPNGTPQTSPVWVDFDDTYVLVNSARGRLKDKNMRQRPQVALSIQDPDDPYRYLEVRGRVVEITALWSLEYGRPIVGRIGLLHADRSFFICGGHNMGHHAYASSCAHSQAS